MELLRLLFASLLLLPASAVSNGNLPICSVDMEIGKGTNVMKWVNAPVDGAQWYSITTTPSVTSYRPGGLTPVTITVKSLDYIYIGLLLVAEGNVNGTMTNVGQWSVLDGDDFFLPAACKFAAVVHKTADLKPLTQTFYWKGATNMGTVNFRALIKQGEQNHGSFYKVATLSLTEGQPIPPQTVWKSEKGASCNEACGRKNMACDQAATLAMNNATLLQAKIKDYYPCRWPYLKTCAPPATGAKSYCYFPSCSTLKSFAPTDACSRRSSDPLMNQQFCACRAGAVVRDPKPPVLNPASTLGLRLPAPLELDAELTLNSLDIQDGIVRIDVTGPQDRWFAIGWDAFSMDNAYATVIWLNDPSIRPPQDYFGIGDKGYRDGFEGWYDVRCQQALNDYCRYVGDKTPVTGVYWFSCALANSTNQGTNAYSSSDPNTFDAKLASRVPCKGGKASPYLPMSVGEYRLSFNPRGFTKLPQTVQVERTLVDNGQFRIVFSRNISGPNPFPNSTSMPLIWSLGVQQFFGIPRGKTAPIKHMKKSETSVTMNLVPIYPVCLSPATSTLPSLLVLLMSALFAGFSFNNNNNKHVVMGVMLLALFVRPSSAHNWVNVPSRAQIAAVTVPCQQRVDPAPHLQVAPGQTFQLEWSTGHGETPTAWTYWVFLKEEHFNRLIDITDSNLEDYLDKAPPASVFTGDQWTRRHLAPLDHANPGCVNCNNFTQFPTIFQSTLRAGDARFIQRNPIAVKKSLQWWHQDVQQYWYPASETNGDKRAQYKSEKYPWIISVHKFHVPNHWPDEYDMATFTFPNMGSGNYIAHFKWGGYRDCTDVHLMANVPSVANPWGLVESANLSSTFARLDHCEFTYVLNPSTRCRTMTGTNASQCLADCLKKDGTFGCTGVQAVLRQNPQGTLPYTENFPAKLYTNIPANGVFPPPENGPCDSRTIHKRAPCGDLNPMCTAADVGTDPTSYICYGLTPYRDQDFQVEEDYVITTDPKDPGFYSTCWVRLAPGGFLPSPAPVVPKPVWRVGEQCVSCDWLVDRYPTFPLESAIPWKDALTTDCRDCDTEGASGCKPDTSFVEGGSRASCGSETPNGMECSATCDPGFLLFGRARQCENGILTGTEQTCTFAGC